MASTRRERERAMHIAIDQLLSETARAFETFRNVAIGRLDPKEVLKMDLCTGLKKVVYEEKEPAQTCSICMEDFKPGEEFLITTCDHTFHRFCLRRWVRVKKECPYCRSQI